MGSLQLVSRKRRTAIGTVSLHFHIGFYPCVLLTSARAGVVPAGDVVTLAVSMRTPAILDLSVIMSALEERLIEDIPCPRLPQGAVRLCPINDECVS